MISKDSLKSMPHPSFRKIATHLCLGVAATSLLSGCMIAQGYSEKEQSIVSAMDGGQYQPASRTSRDNIETQSLLAQATFWSREYQLNPADLESAIKLASAVRRMGNPGQAVQIAQTSRALHPRDPYLTAEYAAALIASEQGEKAIKPLQDGLRLAPQYARLWSLMGAALDQGEKYDVLRKHAPPQPAGWAVTQRHPARQSLNTAPRQAIETIFQRLSLHKCRARSHNSPHKGR